MICALQVYDFLDLDIPALPNLHTLKLSHMKLSTLSDPLASRLNQLMVLDLSCNSFVRFPESVALIPTLQKLDLSENRELQLEMGNIHTLAGLTSLTLLDLEKDKFLSAHWTDASMHALFHISRKVPWLLVQL